MNSIDDTPRTNEREAMSYGLHEGWGLALARQLERELNAANETLSRYLQSPEGRNIMAAQQRDTANRLADELEVENKRLQNELSRALDLISEQSSAIQWAKEFFNSKPAVAACGACEHTVVVKCCQ